MKKKFIYFIIAAALTFSVFGCGSEEEVTEAESTEIIEEIEIDGTPKITSIKAICELSTLETYYHNVAKSTKTAGTGLIHLGEKERTFWVEYKAIVKLGINVDDVEIEVKGTDVTVTVPKGKILDERDIRIEILNTYYDDDGFFNANDITADEQTKAVADSKDEMITKIKEDNALLNRARDRAVVLIQNYIDQLGEAQGIKYNIKWIYK